ncbi:virion structural protein [Enterococcus phage EF_TR1]
MRKGQSGIIEDLGNKNSISIGDTPKPNPIDGDTWFSTRVNEAGQTIHEIKVWDGVEKVWKLSMDTSKAFEAEDTAKAAQKDAEESLVKANKAVEDADTAKTAAQEALDRYNKLMISGSNLVLNSQKITVPDTSRNSPHRSKPIPLAIETKLSTKYKLSFKYKLTSGTLPRGITVGVRDIPNNTWASNLVTVQTEGKEEGVAYANFTTTGVVRNALIIYQGVAGEVKNGDNFDFSEVYLVEGDKIGDWQPAPEDAIASITNINGEITSLVTKTDGLETSYSQISQTVDEIQLTVGDKADKSQITQLQDQINLRVEKDDVINQINVSNEGIIIDGAKVQITGKTYIEDAVITDAMINDLSATKLTAGVIDASKINVTNIDASNIKAGTIQGIDIIGSKITNPFEIGSEGYILTGQTVMERAQVKVDYTVNETGQYGWSSLHARGVHSQLMNKDGTINSFSALASDGLSIQDSQGHSGFLSAELLMQFANTGKKIYPGNSWVTNTDRIIPSLTMDQCAIGWLFLWQPYDTTGGQPYTWDYTYYLVPKAHAIFNNGKGINMRLQGAGSGGGTNDIVYKYVYVSNISISGTANNGTGNGAKWVLTSVFSV